MAVRHEQRIPIVGIGAGGIDAITLFFESMPPDSGMGFVIVTDLVPGRDSALQTIIARCTAMDVQVIGEGMPVQPNTVYVPAENAVVGIARGRLTLRRFDPGRRERKPVDAFLSALAKDQGDYAAGVILSGDDDDGTLGVKAIKECGGVTLARVADGPARPQADAPESAIASGMIDFAVPLQDMPARLIDFARSLALADSMGEADDTDKSLSHEAARQDICALLRNQIGHDFSGYKLKTFHRRVQRRMAVLQVRAIEAYVERLRQEPGEVVALFRDLLINVTTFFRDADAFLALKMQVIPALFEGRGAEETVRVWVPGCATGEEVYSLAMLMREHMDELRATPRVQIFATDIDERSLSAARTARYPEILLDSVSPERRRRFFIADGGSFVVSQEVRDLCIFSPHSVLRDPPFSRMDMVSCRNLLIYFGMEAQNQVIPIFHYSLRPNGYLFLGSSENVSQFGDLFTAIDKTNRIFRSRGEAHPRLHLPAGALRPPAHLDKGRMMRISADMPSRQSIDTHVIENFAPPHVLVNALGDVVYFSSRTGKYLEPAAGAPSRQLMAMARRGLRLDLRSALRDAMELRRPTVRKKVVIETEEDRIQMLMLTVELMPDRPSDEPLVLVLFEDQGPSLSREDAAIRPHGDHDEAVAQLERDLRETREQLQSMIEEHETALEELKSSNEELVAVNEELQFANEELEASKEELQSLNEELHTVNIELSHKVDALDQSNSDLRNLFESTHIATIFLDRGMLIRHFTPPIAELFDVLPTDRGRPLMSFSHRLVYPGLYCDLRRAIETGLSSEQRVPRADGSTQYLARIRSYSSKSDRVEGVVLNLVDVTLLAESEAHQQRLIAELNRRMQTMLGVVIAATRQTARGGVTPEGMASLLGRLESMARADELLSRERWTRTDLADLIATEMALFGGDRTRLQGPVVTVKPKEALSLGIIVHELATNAAKYGALSVPEGHIDIAWSVVQTGDGQRRLHLTWTERGGPLAPAAPRGFGLRLVERETSDSLRGVASIEWNSLGLGVDLDVPLA